MTALILQAQVWLNRRAKALAVRVCGGIHPKHLVKNPTYSWLDRHVEAGQRIADLGCGLGLYSQDMTRHGAEVIAIDRAMPRHTIDVAMRLVSDLEQPLPLASGLMDRVVAIDIVEHLDHRAAFLAECRRLLKPAGLLLITFPNRGTTWRQRLRRAGLDARQDADHKWEYHLLEVYAALDAAGFVPVEVEPMTHDTPWAGVLDFTAFLSLWLYGRITAWRVWRAQHDPTETMGWRIVAKPAG